MVKKKHTRRHFMRQAALVTLGFTALSRCTLSGKKEAVSSLVLRPDPNHYLDLPKGFSYRIISTAGDRMDDGWRVPARADGMGAFRLDQDRLALVRNHENSPGQAAQGAFGDRYQHMPASNLVYDPGYGKSPSLGGTTTLIYNEKTEALEQQFLSLAGTNRNCAGGITPWNSWLTCEEDVTPAGESQEKDHGYVFEVPVSDTPQLANPAPIEAMGRFNHEAVAVDPNSGIVYLTEDRGDGLFYRFLPNQAGNLRAGGRLQALAIREKPRFDTRNWDEARMAVGEAWETAWITMDQVTSPEDDLRHRGFEAGAAKFARGEGIWYGDREIYFACTNGGPNKYGQVFRYQPLENEGVEESSGGVLECYAESPDKQVLHMCDNLTVAPWGDVILAEDNGQQNHIRGITQKGDIYTFALNRGSSSEFAGVVFSPSGKTMFVNIQESGETLAITGPWDSLRS